MIRCTCTIRERPPLIGRVRTAPRRPVSDPSRPCKHGISAPAATHLRPRGAGCPITACVDNSARCPLKVLHLFLVLGIVPPAPSIFVLLFCLSTALFLRFTSPFSLLPDDLPILTAQLSIVLLEFSPSPLHFHLPFPSLRIHVFLSSWCLTSGQCPVSFGSVVG